ncbi:uncharacterized protein TM35_000561140, partial [Trypanosoma theileri]
MNSVMCVLAVVLCCACGYTMAAAASNVASLVPYYGDYAHGSSNSRGSSSTEPEQLLNKPATGVEEVVTLPDANPEVSANGKGEYLVVTFEPITRATYDKYCKKNSSSIINGKNCSVLLNYLEAKAKLPPSPP